MFLTQSRRNKSPRAVHIHRLQGIRLFDRKVKGEPSDAILVHVPGGEVDGTNHQIPDASRFSEAENVVLFLSKTSGGKYEVTAGIQGKFRIENDQVFVDVQQIELSSFLNEIQSIR